LSIDEAVKWLSKAAKQGNAAAPFILGNCYDNGTRNAGKKPVHDLMGSLLNSTAAVLAY